MEYLGGMHSFLTQPYPFAIDPYRKLFVCGGIGLFVALFLTIFQPFGMAALPNDLQWKHALLFGLVTFVVSASLQIILPRLLPSLFKEQQWRSWKEIIFILFTISCVGAGNFWLMHVLHPYNFRSSYFWEVQLITLEVGIFPLVFSVFFKQLTLYKHYAKEAQTVNKEIENPLIKEIEEIEEQSSPAASSPEETITLLGDLQKESIALPANHLFFIASADNYVRVEYLENEQQKSLLLRSSLKKIEEQLLHQPIFFRCHRMYMVNLNKVVSVNGNAQGLRLTLSGHAEEIPVSRNLTATIKEKLHELSHSPQKP